MSRLGKRPIPIPDKVKVTSSAEGHVTVEGPKGKLEWDLPPGISLALEKDSVCVTRSNDSRQSKAFHGLSRALLANMIVGVSNGYRKELEIHGVGFRAAVQGKTLNLSLGKSHPILYPIPENVKISIAENTKITVEGIDKQVVGQVAANIRNFYPPEPYKGKGIRYVGEQIRRKSGKTVQ
ncbi:MAG: 50S ribosomal protein L6 [Chthoniobacterales bacterium]|nr:50S ribosomal protein L6 [Chthoniobacterales bacterium]